MFPISFYIGLILIGIFAGFASGLLGVGGGFLMVPLQFFLFTSVGVDPSLAMMVSLGTSLAIIIPTAASGAYQHQKKNRSIVKPAIRLAVFGIIGGFCGGLVANMVPTRILQIIFACLLIVVALDMLFGSRSDGGKSLIQFNLLNAGIVGFSIGIISGLLGVGGGVFLIPALCILHQFRRSIGRSRNYTVAVVDGQFCKIRTCGIVQNSHIAAGNALERYGIRKIFLERFAFRVVHKVEDHLAGRENGIILVAFLKVYGQNV